uniref:MRG domain binding protein n=1 Tax=Callorhinchus milii TaxID=7868 RepID=A0A4W3HUH1_CALMI
MAEVQALAVEKEREEEAVSWSPEVEVCLFHAMLGHKPVGVNRHFHMICIRDKFSQNIGRQVSSKIVWEHLNVMYDMQALHRKEILALEYGERPVILLELFQHEIQRGTAGAEEEPKEEQKEEMSEQPSLEEGNTKPLEKSVAKEKGPGCGEPGAKEVIDKRKRNRATANLLSANSNPSSPSGAKRRRV